MTLTPSVLDRVTEPAQLRSLTDAELDQLAGELREKMIRTVQQTGGHLASSLGAVEIAIALHRVMDSPRDRIVWDTGHQAYAHKLLTGRVDAFGSLRQVDGIGGFPRRTESDHDVFDGGHAGTGVSIAAGLAAARDLLPPGDPRRKQRIAVCVGDAALASGLTLEALNHLGQTHSRLLIVLNDNEMSISPSVGGLSTRLNRLRLSRAYQGTKSFTARVLPRIPLVGQPAYDALAWAKEGFKRSWARVSFFEDMGITYIGVLDGHDRSDLEQAFEAAFQIDRPVLIHVKTVKGRGYAPAEQDSQAFHGASLPPIDLGLIDPTEEPLPAPGAPRRKPKTYTHVFSEELIRLAEADDADLRHHRRDADRNRPVRVPGPLPDAILRRRHRRAARRDDGHRSRAGRDATGGRDLLDLQPAGLRPARARRLPERCVGRAGHRSRGARRRGRHEPPGDVHPAGPAVAAEPGHRLAQGRAGAARPGRHRAGP